MKFAQRKEKVSNRIEYAGDGRWSIDRPSIEMIGIAISMASMIIFFAVHTQFDLFGLHGEFSNTISAVLSTVAPAVVIAFALFVILDLFTRSVITSFNRRESGATVRGKGTPWSFAVIGFSAVLAVASLIAFLVSGPQYDMRIAVAAIVSLLWNVVAMKCIPTRTDRDRQEETLTEFGPPTDDDTDEEEELRRITSNKTNPR